MVNQADYGTPNDRALVPGSLRVFRHFGVDSRARIITPMNYSPRTAYATHVNLEPARPVYPPPTGNDTTFTAMCRRAGGYRIWLDDVTPPPSHRASPQLDCTCGFYAHYKQQTDFYPHTQWGREMNIHLGRYEMADMIIVRAVCEVSGTVVMGRRGVRAEKMKIVAIAADWSKYRHPHRRLDPSSAVEHWWSKSPYPDYEMKMLSEFEPGEDERRWANAEVEAVARFYGARFYDSWEEMYAEHPEQDVTALGIDPEADAQPLADMPRPNPNIWSQVRADIQRQAQAYANAAQAVQDLKVQLSKLFDIDVDVIDGNGKPKQQKRKPKKGGTMPDHLARALEAKQGRKAPPGSGIDRRRGKLR